MHPFLSMLMIICEDLKPENILLSIPEPRASRISEYIKANPPAIYGPPLDLKSLNLPLVFSCSQPLPYFSLCESIEDISVRLIDYSEGEHILAFIVTHSYRRYINSHSRRRPRERASSSTIYHPRPRSHPQISLDVRHRHLDCRLPSTLATYIAPLILNASQLFELLTNYTLLPQDADNYSHELHLQHMVKCLGPFPLEFLKHCEDRGKYFDEKGEQPHLTILSSTINDFFT